MFFFVITNNKKLKSISQKIIKFFIKKWAGGVSWESHNGVSWDNHLYMCLSAYSGEGSINSGYVCVNEF